MAHVPLQENPQGLVARLATVLHEAPLRPDGRARGGGGPPRRRPRGHGRLETAVQLGWKKLDPTLRWLAIQAASAMQIGCSWCIDYGYYEGMHEGVEPAKVRAAAHWRDQRALRRARAGRSRVRRDGDRLTRPRSPTSWPPACTHLSDAEIVELAAWVALENFRSRFNAGLGLRSQGFCRELRDPALRRSAMPCRRIAVA